MGKFLFFILQVSLFVWLLKQLGRNRSPASSGLVSIPATDLLGMLLQLSKASAQLEVLALTASTETARQKVRQAQALVDGERDQLMIRLQEAGVSELSIQQACSIE